VERQHARPHAARRHLRRPRARRRLLRRHAGGRDRRDPQQRRGHRRQRQAIHSTGFYIHSTKWGTKTHIANGFAGDNVFVGDGDIDKNIAGDLDLGSYGYSAWMTIDDTKATHGQVYQFTNDTLKTLQMRTISFPAQCHLTLNTSSYNDVVGVDGGYGFA
jgi:hypothetical protein